MFPNYLHTNPHLSKEFHIAKKNKKNNNVSVHQIGSER